MQSNILIGKNAPESTLESLPTFKNVTKSKGSTNYVLSVPAEPKLALVIRIKGVVGVSPTFVKINGSTLNMLKKAENYLAWGYPTKSTVSELLSKRGFLRVSGERFPLQNDEQVKTLMGKDGVKSKKELVNALFAVNKNFSDINRKLWHFKLSAPKGGFKKKNKHFTNGGDFGNREELINEMAKR